MKRSWAVLALVAGSLTAPLRATDFTVPSAVKRKYQYLYSQPVETTPDGGKRFHKGRLFYRGGIRVLSLEGDRFEMAFQHGRLLQDVIAKGAVPQSSLAVENAVRNGFPNIPIITNLVIRSFYRRITEGMFDFTLKNASASADQVLLDAYGLSEGSGVSTQTLLYGALGPESLQVLLGERVENPGAAAYGSHCTAFAAWGSRTQDGEPIIGRNTDYPLNGSYDRYPTVIYFSPDKGKQKYMTVTSAGIHNAGVVGFNGSGIYLGVHSIPSTDVSPDGVPAFFLAQEVLRESTTLDEAIQYFKLKNSPSGWAYLVVSTREKKAATVELSNHHHGILPASGEFHVQTNHYRASETSPYYLHINQGTDTDTQARMDRAMSLIQKSPLTAQSAAAILGDKVDPTTGKVRGFPNTIAVHTTMTSAVFEPARQRVWVASGTAPVSVGDYVEFPLVNAFDAATFAQGTFGKILNSAFSEHHPELAKAEQLFIQAKIAYESELDYRKAHNRMEEVLKIDGENPAYRFVAAILALKAGERNRAIGSLTHLVALPDVHLKSVGRYYLARLMADDGKKREAKALFESLLTDLGPSDLKLREAVEAAIKSCNGLTSFKLKTQTMGLMIQQADMLDY